MIYFNICMDNMSAISETFITWNTEIHVSKTWKGCFSAQTFRYEIFQHFRNTSICILKTISKYDRKISPSVIDSLNFAAITASIFA